MNIIDADVRSMDPTRTDYLASCQAMGRVALINLNRFATERQPRDADGRFPFVAFDLPRLEAWLASQVGWDPSKPSLVCGDIEDEPLTMALEGSKEAQAFWREALQMVDEFVGWKTRVLAYGPRLPAWDSPKMWHMESMWREAKLRLSGSVDGWAPPLYPVGSGEQEAERARKIINLACEGGFHVYPYVDLDTERRVVRWAIRGRKNVKGILDWCAESRQQALGTGSAGLTTSGH